MSETWFLNIVEGKATINKHGLRVCDVDDFRVGDVEDIINKLNEYKQLKTENARLKQEVFELNRSEVPLHLMIDELRIKVAEREEALRKLNPYNGIHCIFCKQYEPDGHTDNCEYLRLCGGAE